jgi:hypothetical protein
MSLALMDEIALVLGVTYLLDHFLGGDGARRLDEAGSFALLTALLVSQPSAYAKGSYMGKFGHAPTCSCSFRAYIAYLVRG